MILDRTIMALFPRSSIRHEASLMWPLARFKGASRFARQRSCSHRTRRLPRLGVEALEGRELPSHPGLQPGLARSVHHAQGSDTIASTLVVSPPPVIDSLAGNALRFDFCGMIMRQGK